MSRSEGLEDLDVGRVLVSGKPRPNGNICTQKVKGRQTVSVCSSWACVPGCNTQGLTGWWQNALSQPQHHVDPDRLQGSTIIRSSAQCHVYLFPSPQVTIPYRPVTRQWKLRFLSCLLVSQRCFTGYSTWANLRTDSSSHSHISSTRTSWAVIRKAYWSTNQREDIHVFENLGLIVSP